MPAALPAGSLYRAPGQTPTARTFSLSRPFGKGTPPRVLRLTHTRTPLPSPQENSTRWHLPPVGHAWNCSQDLCRGTHPVKHQAQRRCRASAAEDTGDGGLASAHWASVYASVEPRDPSLQHGGAARQGSAPRLPGHSPVRWPVLWPQFLPL